MPDTLSSYRLPSGAITGITPQAAQAGGIQVQVLTVTVMVSGAPHVLGQRDTPTYRSVRVRTRAVGAQLRV